MRKSYGDLGNAYLRLGELQKARTSLEKDLKIAIRDKDKARQGKAHCNLGKWHQSFGDFQRAIFHHEKHRKIAEKMADKSEKGTAYQNLGFAYKSCKKYQEADECFQKQLNIAKEMEDKVGEGRAYGNLGCIKFCLGYLKDAIFYHKKHQDICRQFGDKVGEGIASKNLGDVYQQQEDYEKAINCHKRSLEIAEKEGDVVAIAESSYRLGQSFAALGFIEDAVACYEQSIELYNGARNSQELSDYCKINWQDTYQRVYTSFWRLLLKQGRTEDALRCAEEGRAQSLKDLMELNYTKRQLPVSRIDDLQKIAIQSDTVFIAFESKEIIFWVLRKGKQVELRRKQIPDTSDDATSFFESLKKIADKQIGLHRPSREGVVQNRGNETLSSDKGQSESSNFQNSPLSTFYQYTIDPIKDLLSGNEIVFVPEGPLCLAPFAAFMHSDSELDSEPKYLCESFRIRLIPSLISLRLLAECPQGKHFEAGALLVGDPLLDKIPPQQRKSMRQLHCAKAEVEMIGQIVNTSPLTRGEATKEEVLKRLCSVALVHIAAHGRMESGEIVLAPSPAGKSKVTEEDYLLTVNDVLSFQIRPRLVVLSCCHTATGKIKAEGVVGIARAFLGAGARCVLVSLWAIDDEATFEFMKNFYQHLVGGESASEALNKAMNWMRESDLEKFNQVNRWAPFVLIGDDVKLKLDKL